MAQLEHRYGDRIHIFDNVLVHTALARLSSPETSRRDVSAHLRTVYESMLVMMVTEEFPSVVASVATRMVDQHPQEAIYRGPILDPSTRVVIVDVIRGGILPAQYCFEMLESVLPEENIRLDHLNLSRLADEEGRVIGVDLGGSKIGGPVDDAVLLIPDPMGATGSTVVRVVEHYREHVGSPRSIIAMPMISTPEFFRAVLAADESVRVYTGRLDRGLSSPEVLSTVPGTLWQQERGLNDHQYIVPGAGGVGEILNNSWC